MKNKVLLLIAVTILCTIVYVFVNNFKFPPQGMVNVSTPSPISTPIPRTYNFDSSTNLEQELETVNPQVLDSDFEYLESLKI